ncbi:MAG: HNH endonuclease family protein [bacterium]|nr:HNH endonuclease family protein [bacterium]
MASRHGRGLVPQRPIVRIVLLLAVAGMASGIAGAVFTGGETAARDPVATRTAPSEAPPTAAPAVSESAAPEPEAAPVEPPPPQPQAAPAEPPAPQPQAASDQPPAPQPEATPNEPPAPEQAPNEPPPPEAATQLVERLRPLVAEQDPNVPDYDRDHFAGWLDDDGDCVNTRHEVLQSEAVDFSMNAEGCAVAAGEWFDPYTDRTYTNPRDLDVDHVVALADAWVSGAWAWADELLDRFSNDFGNLNAIAAGENRSKSARGPADYSPTAPGARCEYLVQYATVKIRWQLSITPQDFEVVATGLSGCEVDIVSDPPAMAPVAPSPPAPPTTVSTQPATDCHPAYRPCLPNLPGDALNCGDLRSDQKPVTVIVPGEDPYRLDRDRDGRGCTS